MLSHFRFLGEDTPAVVHNPSGRPCQAASRAGNVALEAGARCTPDARQKLEKDQKDDDNTHRDPEGEEKGRQGQATSF